MGKYNYDKNVLKGLSVGPFLKQVKVRNQHIEAASDKLEPFSYAANTLANELHPTVQYVKVEKIIERKDAKSFVLAPAEPTKELAYFRAGQYVSMNIVVDGFTYSRPYSISSSPKKALGASSRYVITIKNNPDGFTSKEVNENWKEGEELSISGPLGEFYYTSIRDAKHVVAVAGGSGITPFISMAEAIVDGTEDFKLTIIYGAANVESILFKKELDELVSASKGKVKVVYVLEKETKEGYKHGYITPEIIKENVNGDYSLFVCGPKGLYKYMDNVVSVLKLPRRRFRKEVFGEYGDPSKDAEFPKELVNKEFNLIVTVRNETYKIKCRSNQTLLNAMEKAGIHAPSHCRSGECGWCHSLLKSGRVYCPREIDGRRIADYTFNWIHPCASYPLSDIELEVPYNKEQ